MKIKSTVENRFIPFQNKQIPAKIYKERRRNIRFSVGKKHAICRMPLLTPSFEESNQIKKFEEWVAAVFEKNSRLQAQYFGKDYTSGDVLIVGNRTYLLNFVESEKKMHYAKLRNGTIHLELADDNQPNTQKAIRHLLSRVVAKDFLPHITQRVDDLNDSYFKKDITSVNLKYNTTNWGSCSTKNNVNLSTRLLFAPDDVIDYVIIHELSHLIEMNHSDRFWKIVSDIMPDYEEKEIWLKKNGHLCNF